MRIYGQAILTNSSKESYLLNAVAGIAEYKFAFATHSSNGFKASSGGYGTLGRHLHDDNRMDEDDPRDRHRSASLDDDDRFSHTAIT
jgi:hypothetical protein